MIKQTINRKQTIMGKKLKRELNLIEVICVSAGVMISSGLFILPAIAYSYAGAAMILSYAIGSFFLIPAVFAMSELVTAIPITGGIYTFADRSMGPLMGTIGGMTAWFSLAFKSAFSLLAMGIFVMLLKPNISEFHIKLIGVLCCIFFTIINIRGIKLSSRFQTFIVILLVFFLILYVIIGSFSINSGRFIPFVPHGVKSVFTTAGLIFISFSGTTKIAAIAGEIKNPGRNLPLGILYSWAIVSLIYISVVGITVGILDPHTLSHTFTPVSLGGEKIMGQFGLIIMTIAALLAFISTGNAGLLAASRNPLAMGRDELLPGVFSKISSKGTPAIAILSTSTIMICVILFLDLETFVKTASALQLILFIIANLALIFMREANIHHYRPKFIAPFYPWIQIIGILSYTFLLFQMGKIPLLLVSIFILCSIGWYFLFVHGKITREYAILHVIERVTGIQSTDQVLEEELRDILIERDQITEEWFEKLINSWPVKDLKETLTKDQLSLFASNILASQTHSDQENLRSLIEKRLQDPNIIVRKGIACLSVEIEGRRKFDILALRNKHGFSLSENTQKINALFIVVYSVDEWNCQIHALSRIINMIDKENFLTIWIKAANQQELRNILMHFFKTRERGLNHFS